MLILATKSGNLSTLREAEIKRFYLLSGRTSHPALHLSHV